MTPGPVVTQFSSSHPFGRNQFDTTIRMYPGIQRIDIHTEIVNVEPSVRYRVPFPATIHDGTNTQEIAFGAVERPLRQEFPAQNWADYSAGGRGLAVLNRGLPGNNVTDDTNDGITSTIHVLILVPVFFFLLKRRALRHGTLTK